jgi:hypothetical protein
MVAMTVSDPAFLGNAGIWRLAKTAYFCSNKFSAGSVLKSYDWAADMKRQERCVISGFQSKLEKDVFDLLVTGTQPVIIALPRSLYAKPPAKLKPHVDGGRLLIISPFAAGIGRPNRHLAFQRNQFIVDNADEVVFAHIHEGGMLEKLTLRKGLVMRVLDTEGQ